MSAPKEMRTLAAAKWPSSRDKELTTRCLPWGMSGRSRTFICGVHEAYVCAGYIAVQEPQGGVRTRCGVRCGALSVVGRCGVLGVGDGIGECDIVAVAVRACGGAVGGLVKVGGQEKVCLGLCVSEPAA